MVSLPNTGNFDWESVKAIGMFIPNQNAPDPNQLPKIAEEIFLGKIPNITTDTKAWLVDGIHLDLNTQGVNFSTKFIDDFNILAQKDNLFCLKLENGDYQFIETSEICNEKELLILKKWILKDSQTLLKIANSYEKYGRQFYHFMYDVISLTKCVSKLPKNYYDKLIRTIKDELILMHNRVQAETIVSYQELGHKVTIDPPTSNRGNPDLLIDGILSDVKTILIPAMNNQDSCIKFAEKLRNDIVEKESEKEQIGAKGIFFIAPWSGILNSILLFFFDEMRMAEQGVYKNVSFHTSIPPVRNNITILVLMNLNAFENNYLVFDTPTICDLLDQFAKKGYPQIRKKEPLGYLTKISIRKGCPLGIQSINPSFMLRIR